MKSLIRLLLPTIAFVAAVALAQDANQAQKTPPPSSPPAQDSATTPAANWPATSSPRAALFPMPAIPDEDPADDPVPSSSSSPSGRELFPMPAVPEEGSLGVSVTPSSASSRYPELFPMPAIPEEDHPSTPAPLTEAELEMQALIQSAIGNNPAVTAANVTVAFSAEGIELSGTVASAQAKLAASRLAKSYAAGRKVVDRITVAANPPEMHPEPSQVRADSPATAHQQHP
jgi:BON domain